MKTLAEVKAKKEAKYSKLMKDCGLFWAFSSEQFHEGKTPLREGEKYVSIGGGGYLPQGNVKAWISGTKEIEAWFRAAIKGDNLRRANIAYELNNHEAFYTGSVEETLEALGPDYTKEEVIEVYREEVKTYERL